MESVHGVDAHIGSAALAKLGFTQLSEKWKRKTAGFPVEDPAAFFVLRDSNWAKLGDAPTDVIYARFLSQPTGKRAGPTIVFKAPKSAWVVFLEVEEHHKIEIEEHIEAKEHHEIANGVTADGTTILTHIADAVLQPRGQRTRKVS